MKKDAPVHAQEKARSHSEPESLAVQLRRRFERIARSRSLRDPLAGISEDLQLTAPQTHAIIWLGNDGPLTMGHLARRAGIHDKSITGVVDRLETMGLVERGRSPEDRRAVTARLTEKGQKVYDQLDESIDAALSQMLVLLDPEDQAVLFRLLDKIGDRLEERRAQASQESDS